MMEARSWKFYRDNAADWIRLCGSDVYLHAPYDKPFDIDQFPWHLDVQGGEVAGWANNIPSGIRFEADDPDTGIHYRWCVDTYVRSASGTEFAIEPGRIADLMRKLDTPERRAMFEKAMRPSIAGLTEELARADKYRARMVADRAILRDAMGGAA